MGRFLAVALLLAAPLAQLGDARPAILRTLRLPALVTEARRAGVPEAAVRDILDGRRRVAGETAARTAVDRAVAVARAIQVAPPAADSVLAAHGFTRAGFDALLYDIAVDPALARAYAEGIR